MRPVKGDQGTSRAINRHLILNHLRRSGPLSRTQLAESIGLSGAAVSFVSADLLEERLIVETVPGLGGRGVPLDINYSGHVAIGVKVMETRLEAVLTDASIKVLGQARRDFDSPSPEQVADSIGEVTQALLTGLKVKRRPRFIGVGVALPGIMDSNTGLVYECQRFGWRDAPLGAMVTARTGSPTWIDNDVNAFAVAERLFGHGKHVQDFVVLTNGRGVGAALVLSGAVYHGRNGGAGEIGHTPVVPDGRLCECGRRGCLEAYVSEPNLLARYAELNPTNPCAAPEELADRARAGDKLAQDLLGQAGAYLGWAIASLLNLLNPELVVVGGEGVRLGDSFLTPLREGVSTRAIAGSDRDVPIEIVSWGDDAWAQGAAALAVESFFAFSLEQKAASP